jgi:hypothetical protein
MSESDRSVPSTTVVTPHGTVETPFKLPAAVHNSVRATRRLGSRGFRAWLEDGPVGQLEDGPVGRLQSWVPKRSEFPQLERGPRAVAELAATA